MAHEGHLTGWEGTLGGVEGALDIVQCPRSKLAGALEGMAGDAGHRTKHLRALV